MTNARILTDNTAAWLSADPGANPGPRRSTPPSAEKAAAFHAAECRSLTRARLSLFTIALLFGAALTGVAVFVL